eukprot:Platyproteum_vivax@DN10190_c0_g1_i1.p1
MSTISDSTLRRERKVPKVKLPSHNHHGHNHKHHKIRSPRMSPRVLSPRLLSPRNASGDHHGRINLPKFKKKEKGDAVLDGYIGSLSVEQKEALKEIKGQVKPHPSFNDQFLLRFLRARKFNVDEAHKMIEAYSTWRTIEKLDTQDQIYPFEKILRIKKEYPHGYYGTDKLGRPIYIERIGKINVDDLLALTSIDVFSKYYCEEYERLLSLRMPACSLAYGKRVETSLAIMDMTGLTMKHFSSKCQGVVKHLTKICQDYYPETLGQMYIINPPRLFSWIWNVVKMWIDPKTKSKIRVMTDKNEMRKELAEIVDLDRMPVFIGGTMSHGSDDENAWMAHEWGPWMDPKIVQKLIYLTPHMNTKLVYPSTMKNVEKLPPLSAAEKQQLKEVAGDYGLLFNTAAPMRQPTHSGSRLGSNGALDSRRSSRRLTIETATADTRRSLVDAIPNTNIKPRGKLPPPALNAHVDRPVKKTVAHLEDPHKDSATTEYLTPNSTPYYSTTSSSPKEIPHQHEEEKPKESKVSKQVAHPLPPQRIASLPRAPSHSASSLNEGQQKKSCSKSCGSDCLSANFFRL